MATTIPANAAAVATTSRKMDTIIFAVILAAMILSAPRLIVYDRSRQIGGTSVTLVAVTAAGARLPLELPASFQDRLAGVRVVQERVRDFARTRAGHTITPPDGRLEWTLGWVVLSGAVRVKLARTVVTEADAR